MNLLQDEDFLQFAAAQESQFIEQASVFAQRTIDRINGVGGSEGDPLPWSKTHAHVSLRPGEVSIWAGVNGHGKSMLLGMVSAWGLLKSKWLIASLEMLPEATMARMIRQIAQNSNPPDEYVNRFLTWTDGKLWLYDQQDTVQADRIIAMVHYAAQTLGVNHIVIDSLMKCGIGTDDYNSQKAFLDRLCWAAKAENIHIHLVHHVRKTDKESSIPDKFDIKGAGEITDMVDNVFIVWRNKRKEGAIQRGEEVDEQEPDCLLRVAKQRHGEWEGNIKLWMHGASLQYVPDARKMPMTFKQ